MVALIVMLFAVGTLYQGYAVVQQRFEFEEVALFIALLVMTGLSILVVRRSKRFTAAFEAWFL